MSNPLSLRTTALLAAGLVIACGGVGLWVYRAQPWQRLGNHQLAAGVPLQQSSSEIQVLSDKQDMPQTLTQSSELLPSQAQIRLASETAPAPRPAVFDKTAAQLGTAISLLVSSWPNGGTLPRTLADTAASLAEQTGQPAVADAAKNLRTATPREGPLTIALLMVDTSNALMQEPPANLPADDTEAEAQKSWLRKQIEQLVSIRSTPDTQNRWSSSLLIAQQQIARGMVTDAIKTLESSPLESDNRLSELRGNVRGYLDQTGKLTNLVTTYSNTFLENKGE